MFNSSWWINFSISHPIFAELIENFIGIFVILFFIALIGFVIILSLIAFTESAIVLGITGIIFAIFLMALASTII